MTAPTDLLPCPFCGQPATAYRAKPTEYRDWVVECNSCRMATHPCVSKREAAEKWNRRATSPAVREIVDTLAAAIESRADAMQMLDDIDTGIACGLRLAADMVRGAVSGGGMDMNCGQRSKHNNTERKA